jgi:hypothetical protein
MANNEPDESIEDLATRWLAAERLAEERGNAGGSEGDARSASADYDAAVAAATSEDLLVAWHAAQKLQAATEMGSRQWAEAREVSELLRVEYLAAAETQPVRSTA